MLRSTPRSGRRARRPRRPTSSPSTEQDRADDAQDVARPGADPRPPSWPCERVDLPDACACRSARRTARGCRRPRCRGCRAPGTWSPSGGPARTVHRRAGALRLAVRRLAVLGLLPVLGLLAVRGRRARRTAGRTAAGLLAGTSGGWPAGRRVRVLRRLVAGTAGGFGHGVTLGLGTGQPGVDVGEQPLPVASSGAREARTDIRASSASCVVGRGRGRRAWWRTAPASREPNSSGSSAPSATVAPASSSCGSGTEVRSRVDAERDVGDRAHLEGDARPRRPGRAARGSSADADAVAEPVGVQLVEAGRGRCPGPSSSPPCGAEQQPGALGDREGRREVARSCRGARRWTARSRPRRGRRTARPAGPASGRRAGAGCGWRRSPPPCPRPVARGRRRAPRRAPGR